jgi:YD repeat-containing protein
MTSETRLISQPTTPLSYLISYQYNLIGQLSSITDPNNKTINYTRDSIGRLSTITGPSFAGITSYLSGLQYRAWGAVKHANYGSGFTSDATYNSRMKAASFLIPTVMSKIYDYYADGTLKFSGDLLDHRFDRLYRWDHAGRISEAYSGAEARNEGPTTNRPYKQLYGYDAMGHVTQRTNSSWSLGPTTTTDSYTNNRHNPVGQLWQYDADGNLLMMPGAAYTYNAGGGIDTAWSGSSATFGLDGNGKKVKSVEVTWDPVEEIDVTSYGFSIYSSVLGRVLTEKVTNDDPNTPYAYYTSTTFVYGDSGVIARQESNTSLQQWVWWEHRDPSNASYTTGNPARQQELDPTGANQGISDASYQSIPEEGILAPYPATNNPSQPNMAYSIDGIRVSLDDFIQNLQIMFKGDLGLNEALARQSANDANYQSRWVPDDPEIHPERGESGDWEAGALSWMPSLAWLGFEIQKSQTPRDPRSIFDKFIAQNPNCAKKVQEAGNKLGLGDYLKTPWQITDTLPIYDKAGVIPGQNDPSLSTPRNYFDAHPGWAATTLFDPQGNRAGTFLGERYHIYWIDNPDYSGPGSGPVFVSRPRGDLGKKLIMFDESLHNYFHMGHIELANTLGVAFKGSKDIDAVMALEAWAKGGCK